MITWRSFESGMCNILSQMGYWALNIPKNPSGAQPFDIIALAEKNNAMALDCKVCGKPTFPISRVEANQWTALSLIKSKLKDNVMAGVVIWYDGDVYYLSIEELKRAVKKGQKSIRISKSKFANSDKVQASLWFSKEYIATRFGITEW